MPTIVTVLLTVAGLQAALVGAIVDGARCGATAPGRNVPGACRPTAACSSFGQFTSYCVQTAATSGEACASTSAVCGGGLSCSNGACQYSTASAGGSCSAQGMCSSGATCSRSAGGSSVCVSTAAPSGASCGAFQTACLTGSGQSCISGTCQYSTTVAGGYCEYDGECPSRATCWYGYTCRAANTVPNGGGCTSDIQCAASTAACLSKSDRGRITSTCGPTNTVPYGGNCEGSGDCTSTYVCSAGPTGSTCAVKNTGALGRRHLQPTQLPLGQCANGLSACSVQRKGKQVHECVDLASDIEHCGSCSNSCDDLDDGMGTLTCSEGKCVPHNTDGSTRTLSQGPVPAVDAYRVGKNKHSRTSTGNDVKPQRRALRPKRHL
ncbi:hypothetical protein P389DRAFT_186956 [Cystobasidium minutum MCA 4210]|uniref:uncharacterized protein n=1 Tax=Cystobasidium minutum MCA 4210 TaxID=1397322 RepID=UPI0034CEEC05|eukprot:jgi/Rhomi1/186956/estExt_fgenesh1_pg.C_1_t10205